MNLDSKSNTILSELICHVLLRGSLDICLCSESRMLDLESMAQVQSSLGVTFCYWNFLFSCSKTSDANFGIIANVVCCENPYCNPTVYSKVPGLQKHVFRGENPYCNPTVYSKVPGLQKHVFRGGSRTSSRWKICLLLFAT